MIVLGIDPGFRFSGFGVLKKEEGKVALLDYGLLRLSPSENIIQRIGKFNAFFDHKLKIWEVNKLCLETSFLGKNAQVFLKLGYLRGILSLLANQHDLILEEFAPREVKLSVTGFGGAGKEQVSKMIFKFFPSIKQPIKDDVTDALAITLCGIWKN